MNILQKPLITEKMSSKAEKLNQYGFIVDKSADKSQIKEAVEEKYDVTVLSVNTIRYAGKVKSRYTKGGMITGKTNSYKKAIVSLKEGDQIDFYSNI
ncbi:MAG: 50S ribosomal protein L23 [Bacteroidales bacterium]|jgi:large subunit ribosomal protein L23|nr:50S ribosomal protein L23 [Bacteroidales bacterium]